MKPRWPERLLGWAVRQMPAERQEWGAAMLAELVQLEHPAARRQFALSCTRAALFPPPAEGRQRGMIKALFFSMAVATLVGFLLWRPETGGVWLAWAITAHTYLLIISKVFFGDMLVLAAVTWGVVRRARGRPPWARIPAGLRRWSRLGIEVYFGLLNPVLYLTILGSWLPLRRLHTEWLATEWWLGPLLTLATTLLVALWAWRLCGAAFHTGSRLARLALRALLIVSLACVLAFAAKDATMLWMPSPGDAGDHRPGKVWLVALAMSPLYLIPIVLVVDYLRSDRGFYLLASRPARIAVALAMAAALGTFGLASQRRPETQVRDLVTGHRAAIQSAAARYDVDPRLIAAIVHVTHRDQLSPLRDSVERLFAIAWVMGLPDKSLDRALDLSLGLAQIKPRTAQTAALLAAGRGTPDPKHGFFDVEPVGTGWPPSIVARTVMDSPLGPLTDRKAVVEMLLRPEKNLEMCAVILALYQRQWEAARPDWSIRARPDILATLYQIGFSRSTPHGAPLSNAFGRRVHEVYGQPWLSQLFPAQE